VIPSTIACGACSYCRAGYFAQCDDANPNGKTAGTAFFGGPKAAGPFHGLQAERARIPFAHVGLVRLPEEVRDEDAILISDIFPTGYFGAHLAEIRPGNTVAVLGCGPVGQFAIASARLLGAGRIIAIDSIPSRLDMARAQGAEAVDFEAEDPVEAVRELTRGAGVDRAIDAVGVDAVFPGRGPAAKKLRKERPRFEAELDEVAPERRPDGENWVPGDAPSLALEWAVELLAKAGTLSVIGVYPPSEKHFPIGQAMNKNLTIKAGNCNHRRYAPMLVDIVRSGQVRPSAVLTQVEPLGSAIEAYRAFDARKPGWVKVELRPAAEAA
jgi:threonine dehydrogenase-like Zn-dependent dehydrogenase